MIKHRRLTNVLIIVVLLFSLSVDVLAQGLTPPPGDPGVSPDGKTSPGITVEEGIEGINAWAFSGGPNYDSGWVSIQPDTNKTLTHNLGGDLDNYVVDMQYRNDGMSGVNQRYYGGADFGANPPSGMNADDRVGAYWRSLTDTSITVYRRPEDIYAEDVRIRIWIDPYPTYDSGWITVAAGSSTTLNHALGGDANDYVVDMQYRMGGSNGVNQRYYGGADFGAVSFDGSRLDERVGLYWRSLTNADITLFRRAEDNYASEVRIRIWVRPTPTFDSGWVTISQDTAGTLIHDIGGNPDDYVVDMQYRSGGVNGINQRYYGGADFGANTPNPDARMGAYWRSLTDTSITVYRRPEDTYAPEVRIRIWCFWTPPAPDYDSGWLDISLDTATTLNHNLGGNTDDYLVNMQYRNEGMSGVNQRYYGGADFGANAPSGMNADDRVGAYWRNLTDTSIIVYRRLEDIYAAEVRIRIWIMPKPDYDSGWVALAPDTSTTFTHNLQGDYFDYMVDLQYRNAGNGVNHRYYGGADFGANTPNPDARVGVYWRGLDLFDITVYRRPEDIYADDVRVRIWRVARPGYESGWQVVGLDSSETWTHNLGGSADNYLVEMMYYDEDFNYINQRHLGGADFGSSPPGGYNENDRVGAYWRSLTAYEITVYRRPEDGFADYLRVRIWDYNSTLYLPVIFNQ